LTLDVHGNKCGSKLHIRSYDEQASSYEGQDYNFIHWDEPPPRDVWLAAERGKIVTNAPSIYTMTPLKEPWIYDELSLKASIYA
jgi:phage terminase large subunit-like protein